MSNIEIRNDNRKEIMNQYEDLLLKALTQCGMVAEGHAKVNLTTLRAVDTGLLRNSITYGVTGKSPDRTSYKADRGSKTGKYTGSFPKEENMAVYVGTNVEYAPYIEFGTGKHNSGGRKTTWSYKDRKGETHKTSGRVARPYLKPAVTDHANEYEQIMRNTIHM